MPTETDDAGEIARQAYDIYRGMKKPATDPHWEDLHREQRGLLEWVVRFTRINGGQ